MDAAAHGNAGKRKRARSPNAPLPRSIDSSSEKTKKQSEKPQPLSLSLSYKKKKLPAKNVAVAREAAARQGAPRLPVQGLLELFFPVVSGRHLSPAPPPGRPPRRRVLFGGLGVPRWRQQQRRKALWRRRRRRRRRLRGGGVSGVFGRFLSSAASFEPSFLSFESLVSEAYGHARGLYFRKLG